MPVPRIAKRNLGFTLIELLVVIAIIAVLIALALAGGPVGPRGGPADPVHQQPEADRPGDCITIIRVTTASHWVSRDTGLSPRTMGLLERPRLDARRPRADADCTTHATSASATICRTATDIMPIRRSPIRECRSSPVPSDPNAGSSPGASPGGQSRWTRSTSAMSPRPGPRPIRRTTRLPPIPGQHREVPGSSGGTFRMGSRTSRMAPQTRSPFPRHW